MLTLDDIGVDVAGFSLRDIRLAVNDGEYFVLIGPTGSGKTVLLETIAGLHRTKTGRILLDGSDITSAPPEKRGISIVYQDYSLFPHLTVAGNVAFGLKCARRTDHEISEAIDWVAPLFGIGHLLQRKPSTLSGGERQKVALARAMATRPAIILLDEPLSAVDPETREVLQEELRRLHVTLGMTIVHVTHSFEEAMALGERVGVLGQGRLHQVGTAGDIFSRPDSEFVARFTMAKNIFHGAVNQRSGNSVFAGEGISFRVVAEGEGSCCAVIRPELITLSDHERSDSDVNCISAKVVDVLDKGALYSVALEVPARLSSLVSRVSMDTLHARPGQSVYACFDAGAVHLLRE